MKKLRMKDFVVIKVVSLGLKGIVLLVILMMQSGQSQELDVKASIDIAIENNPQIIAQQEKVNAAAAKLGQAASNLLPHVKVEGAKGKNYSESPSIVLPAALGGGSFSSSPNEAADVTTYSLSVTQPVFMGGKILTGIAISRVAYDAELELLSKTKNDVAFNITSAYYDVLKAQKALDVLNETIVNMKKTLKQVEVYYLAGVSTNSDVLQMQTQIANIEVSRIQLQNGLMIAKLAYETSLGKDIELGYTLKDDIGPGIPRDFSDKETIIAKAFVNRPDWKAYKLAMKAAEQAVNMNYSDYLPSVVLLYSTGKTHSNYSTTSYDLSNWRMMLSASWTLFDGFNTQSKIKEATAQYNNAKANESSIKDGIEMEVSAAYLTLIASQDKVSASSIAADLSQRALKSIEVNYNANTITNLAYLSAQTAYQAAMTNLWTAKFDLQVAKAKLNKAVGAKVII